MSWYGLDNLDKAMDKTKEILLPFNISTWTKIAVIAVLATGVGPGFNLPGSTPDMSFAGNSHSVFTPDAPEHATTNSSALNVNVSAGNMSGMAFGSRTGLAVLLLLVFVAIGGFFLYISSLFQFIYYQTVLDEKPSIMKNMRKYARKGLQYFGFKIVYILFLLATLAIPLAALGSGSLLAGIILLLIWLPIVIAATVFSGLVNHFALLKMMEGDEGLVQAWRDVWPKIRAEWREVAVFEITRFFVGIALGIAQFTAMIALLVLLIVPFGVMGFIGLLISPVLLLLVAFVGVVTFLIVMLYVKVPLSTYMYTYVTLNYHDVTSWEEEG
ncbi:MAG: hypothetical protein ABEJ87_01820 [Candidatus Nanohalobium sp.]